MKTATNPATLANHMPFLKDPDIAYMYRAVKVFEGSFCQKYPYSGGFMEQPAVFWDAVIAVSAGEVEPEKPEDKEKPTDGRKPSNNHSRSHR